MSPSGLFVAVTAAVVLAAAVGGGALVALHWPEGGLRHVVHDSPLETAAFAVGLILLGVAAVFFATVPWGS
jgi:hypothetical protein